MSVEKAQKVIKDNKDNIAFVIGNGINRYSGNEKYLSWLDLLRGLWKKTTESDYPDSIEGLSYTEFFDVLEIEKEQGSKSINLQKEVCQLMEYWKPQVCHKKIIQAIESFNAPILTTNFENIFADCVGAKLYKLSDRRKFSDFYPWSACYSTSAIETPESGFAIWHLNGMIKYHRSIKLGLSHYMGNVERVRSFIHNNEKSLYDGKNQENWKGRYTWLHLIFNKSLFIFGLSLDENEIFLRWLLIERARYFRQFHKNFKGWYISVKNSDPKKNPELEGKKLFFKRVGIEIIEVENYKEIYEDLWEEAKPFESQNLAFNQEIY